MKTPISYYGGKQKLVRHILPLIPPPAPDDQYVEPFCGGAAIFWAKRPHQAEAINDYDLRVANFYEVLKEDFDALAWLVQNTMHSEYEYHKAGVLLKAGLQGNPVEFAWAFWVHTNMSFGYKLHAGLAFRNDGMRMASTANKRAAFTHALSARLARVEIFNRDALDLIRLKDSPNTFFYLDPPYPEADAGHYDKGKELYYDLLALLPSIQARWLMSSYPSKELDEVRQAGGYSFRDIRQRLSARNNKNFAEQATKTECLTWNYQVPGRQAEIMF